MRRVHNRRRWYAAGTVLALLIGVAAGYAHYRRASAPDASALGVPIVVGHTVYLSDGTVRTVDLGPDWLVSQLVVVPSGLVLGAYDVRDASTSIWWQEPDRSMRLVGVSDQERFTISDDGRLLVAVGLSPASAAGAATASPRSGVPASGDPAARRDDTDQITVFDLASGTVKATTSFANADVIGAAAGWILLGTRGSDGSGSTAVWNVRTGKLSRFIGARGVTPLAVTDDGKILRRVELPSAGSDPPDACYDLVTPADLASTRSTGACNGRDIIAARLSPDGRRLLVATPDDVYIIGVCDLVRSRWKAARLRLNTRGSGSMYWATNSAVVIPNGGGFQRCTISGRCHTYAVGGAGMVGSVRPGN